MSAAENKAVFLSYASQDAEAARRLCDTLRASGIEVWFDVQGGLEHGDEWDAKIRRQIKECVLFIPLISASTQARHEGYFRIEWELAAQRAMGIAGGVPFILPVVIDDTREPAALVPDRFRAVQWTKLRGGEVPPDVLARFLALWSQRTGAQNALAVAGRGSPLLPSGSAGPTPSAFETAKPAPADRSVAVLPFANQSSDRDNEYFSDGIAEELLTTLQKIPGLRVSARTSAWSFKSRPATAQEVGEKLGVAHVVEGSVQKSGNRVKITARLSRAASNEEVWSRSFGPLELTDVFAMQSDLAQTIVGELRGRLTDEAAASAKAEIRAQVELAQRGGTKHADAHHLFLQGRFFATRAISSDVVRGIDFYERALRLDPAFATAWADLARARIWQGTWEPEHAERFAQARMAAERALALDPDLASSHAALSQMMQRHFFEWRTMRTEIARAVALAPSDAAILTDACSSSYMLGEWDRAIDFGRRAVSLDPLNPEARLLLGVAYLFSGHIFEARDELRRAIEISPDGIFAHLLACMVELEAGQPEAALALAKCEPARMHRLEGLALAQDACGRRAESDLALQALKAEFADSSPYKLAHIYAARGQPDDAFHWLDHAWRVRDPGIAWTKVAVLLRSLHTDPRWPEFMRKVGLSDEQLQ